MRPLWVWNNIVTEEEIDKQLEELHAAGIGGVFLFIHGPDWLLPIFSDRWHSLCRYSVDKAKELGMLVWLLRRKFISERFLQAAMCLRKCLNPTIRDRDWSSEKWQQLPEKTDMEYVLILKKEGTEFADITGSVDREKTKIDDYYVFEKAYYGKNPWFGGFHLCGFYCLTV